MSSSNFDSRLAAHRQWSRRRRKVRELPSLELYSSWTFRPKLQVLEDRTVPAGTVKLSQGLLVITGTTGVDTALIQQLAAQGNQGEQVAVTLNGATSTFKVSQVNQITASLLAGNDTITLDESVRRVTPPLQFDSAGGIDSLIYKGTNGDDAIAVTGSTISLAGAGTLTYTNFESLTIDCLGGNDTVTVTMGTLAGQLTVRAGTVANSNIDTVATGGILDVSEVPFTIDAGLLRNSTFGTVLGQVRSGSIVDTTFTSIAPGGTVLAAGQGTTTNVSIGTLSGSFAAPEDPNPGSGVMSNTTIGTITSTGTVSTGNISGMTVGTAATGSSITAAGQGTTTNVSIGTLSGSFAAPEDPNPGSGVMSNTTIGTITSTGTVSTGNISGMTVGTAAGSITAAGQGTTTNVSIGTLSGSFAAPEDPNPGSGVMSNTSIGSITSSGSVSTGAISGMTVGTNAGSIRAAGHGTITNISINLNSGTVTAEKDANAGSGVISNATVGTMTPSGEIIAETELVNLSVTTIQGGNFEAGRFGTVSATNVVVDEVRLVADDATRTLLVGAVPGFVKPESFSFTYNGTAPGNPVTTVQVNPGPATNIRYDFSLLTDTVGVAGSGIDLKSFTSNGKAFLRNLVVAGDLKPAQGTLAVNLPQDSVAVAAAGNIPAGSIKVLSAPAVAAGSFNGIAATNATAGNAAALFAPGTTLVQANDTFQAVAGDGVPVAMFIVTGSNFNADNLLFTDQGTDNLPVTAALSVAASSPSAVQQVDMTGEAAALKTKLPVMQAINVLSGSLGDLTLISNQDTPSITAPRIIGNLNLSGRLTRTIETMAGDIGRAFTNAAGVITGVTTVSINAGGGITSTGRIISAGNLVSTIITQSSMDGVIAAQGDIGVIQTDSSGNAVVGTGPDKALTRFGGITVSTGGMNGSIVALGNTFGDINVGGGWAGQLAVMGRLVQGLDTFRTGILGNLNINGGMSPTGVIVSAGLIGDDGINSTVADSPGTKLNISGATKGILAAEADINFGSVGNLSQAKVFENAAGANKTAIDNIFTNGGIALMIPDGLSLILVDLASLRVGVDGNLTGTTP